MAAPILKNISLAKSTNITSLCSSKNVFTDVKGSTRNVNLRILKDRIGAVNTVKKISQVMKLLTQQRIGAIQKSLFLTRSAIEGPSRLWDDIKVDLKGKKNLFVVLSSDKGMCGGINAQTYRFVRDLVRERVKTLQIQPSIIALGEIASKPLLKLFPNEFQWHASMFNKYGVSFQTASFIAERVLESNAEVMTLVYNTYINQISYELTTREFILPVGIEQNRNFFHQFEFAEDATNEHLGDIHQFSLATFLFQALAENSASENAARLLAMDGAAKNAGDLAKIIERQYNKARQGKITTELLEIVAAAMFTPKK